MSDAILTPQLTLDEYIQRLQVEDPFEIIDRELVPKMANVAGHGDVVDNVVWVLNQHIRPVNLGKTFTETPYVLIYQSQWVKGARIPDVMMIVSERLAAYQQQDSQWHNKPLVIVPDLVVEVVSPNDTFSEVSLKVRRYLQDGVRLVWVLDLLTREVTVHQSGVRQTEILGEGDTLMGGEVLPGFAVTVSTLFPPIISD